ncbi:response regulator [Dyadobacter fanqingshengii]|uniref:Response regulator n=1 Tax=Dyadobacter fanqingshengii TaxID=2906443 RepID=A0A9X1PAJ3_9BACT|nr:response regulator [Dyadobacter fanqingshengii]MCF0040088.1 response regulator [Dyadobacter fanqingshengii]MCF2502404.1 response regulator [Dyadobacter fanqingshengii]USJ38160.1 response regulator [Dyadobacter fanqingshengii]
MNREIFIVDDNTDYQFIFFKLLKELNTPYSVKFFENAKTLYQHSLVLSKQGAELPSLIVSDFNMPGMNGLQLLRELKKPVKDSVAPLGNIPVIIMSNALTEQQIVQCYQAGANAVVLKPIELALMRKTVSSIFEFWLERDKVHSGG